MVNLNLPFGRSEKKDINQRGEEMENIKRYDGDDTGFLNACGRVEKEKGFEALVLRTHRQYRKWVCGKGLVYKTCMKNK